MSNADKPAMPIWTDDMPVEGSSGLSKRERFAMAAMQGLCGMEYINQTTRGNETEGIPKMAVEMADALLKELDNGVQQ